MTAEFNLEAEIARTNKFYAYLNRVQIAGLVLAASTLIVAVGVLITRL